MKLGSWVAPEDKIAVRASARLIEAIRVLSRFCEDNHYRYDMVFTYDPTWPTKEGKK